MLSNISWSEYMTFVFVSALIWYAFVFFSYYRQEFVQVIQGKNAPSKKSFDFSETLHATSLNQTEYPPDSYKPKPADISQIVQGYTDEVNAYFEGVNADEIEKDSLVSSLQIITSRYPSLSHSEYKESLSQNLIDQVKINWDLTLNDDDLKKIWSEVYNS